MSFSPNPNLCASDIFVITPERLQEKGITLLLLDLDNTLSPYSEHLPSDRILSWMEAHKAAGTDLYMISNNRGGIRVKRYAEACKIPYISRAGKPNPKSLHIAMEQMKKSPDQTALMGDQIFTDVLAANRADALSILIRPLKMNAWHRIRYILEQPLRLLGKERW